MKITVPSDYHSAFTKAITIARLVESGRFAEAFDVVEHCNDARAQSALWSANLDDRRTILNRCETRLIIGGYIPDAKALEQIDSLALQIAALPHDLTLSVDDKGASILSEALETYARLSMGQVSDVLDDFSMIVPGFKPTLREVDAEVINDMRHLAITRGGESFGITGRYVPDEARNAWMARSHIRRHLAFKNNPAGGVSNIYDAPMRIGSCSPQDIVINDPEFKIPSPEERAELKKQKGMDMSF